MKKPSKRDYALVDSLVNSPCDYDLCSSVNHGFNSRDYHGMRGTPSFKPCPVVARIRAAWARIVAAQEPKPKKEKP